MKNEIEKQIVSFMQQDLRREYTIPEIIAALSVKNREKIVSALARLEERGIVEVPRQKGRTKHYRLVAKK
jgi:hypothetical protein